MKNSEKISSKEAEVRQNIIDHCIKMNDSGLNQGTSGNISVRQEDTMLITPTGMDYHELKIDDLVKISMDTGEVLSHRKPSSEWRFHLDILKAKKDVHAVVHNHSKFATSVSICRKDIPAYHYMVAVSGGCNVRCAEYATFGTEELSENILKALENRNCCLLANHGMVATGVTLEKAFGLAVEVENLSMQFIFANLLKDPYVLDNTEMDKVLEKFKTYGKQD